jgi:uncharacterized repeat protein (TIGR01451 family)
MKPLFLCSLSLLLALLLGCGTKFIDVNVSVTDANDKPLPANGTWKYRTERDNLNFSNNIATVSIAKPKEGEEIFLDVSCPGYEREKGFYPVDEGQTITVKLATLRPRIEITQLARPTRLKPNETCNVQIIVDNTGEGAAKAVNIKDILPKDFEYVTGSVNSSSSKLTGPQIADDSLTWSLESLLPFETVRISYELRLNSNPKAGERPLDLFVSSTDLAERPIDKESVSFLYVEPGEPIFSNGIKKKIVPEKIESDITEVKCTIELENSGNGKAIAVILEDNWPQGFVYKKDSLKFDTKQSGDSKIIVEGPIGNAPYIWKINVLPASTKFNFSYFMMIDPKTIKQGSQSITMVVKAISESGENIKEDYSSLIFVDTEMDVPEPKSAEVKASFKITKQSLEKLKSEGITDDVLKKLEDIENQEVTGEENFVNLLNKTIGGEQTVKFKSLILKYAEVKNNHLPIPPIPPVPGSL